MILEYLLAIFAVILGKILPKMKMLPSFAGLGLGFCMGTLFVRHAVRETDARWPCAYFSRTLSPKILEVGNYDMQRVQNSLTKLGSEDLEAF